MPEYLAPGVYVEEVSYRSKSIEGVSTTTTGFVGPTRYGPTEGEPELITSLGEFERIYGDGGRLEFEAGDGTEVLDNYVWHAARSFFEQGGKRLYVQRVFGGDPGFARTTVGGESPPGESISVRARFPGLAGRRRVRFTVTMGQNLLSGEASPPNPRLTGLRPRDVVYVGPAFPPTASPPPSPPAASPPEDPFHLAVLLPDGSWQFTQAGSPSAAKRLDELVPGVDQVRVVTVTLTVLPPDPEAPTQVWADLPLDPEHETGGARDSIFARFAARPSSRAEELTVPLAIEPGSGIGDGVAALEALLHGRGELRDALMSLSAEDPEQRLASTDEARSFVSRLEGGGDGARPRAADYEGGERDVEVDGRTETMKSGLRSFEDLEDISIVAAPGSTFGAENGYGADAEQIARHLIGHAERMRYRIAVLDSGEEQTVAAVRAMRATVESDHAALYYPWVRVLDPIGGAELLLPPSGFVAGIYARNDTERGVWKAPANEVVTGAIGFATTLGKGQQEVLNPEGVNCFRFFEGRGYRLWGARTISSDPEWKYVNLRRYFAYLEHSIDRGTQWAVFEPNGDRLWANVRRTISDFLFNEWQSGALLGEKPEKAFFVRCDRSTMTPSDIDNGRLVCQIGVAALRPAEFVIFRIGQWTADRRA
jgi:phage tail sheath protein FI